MIAFADLYPTLLSIMGFQQQIPEEVQTFNLASVLLCGKENNHIVQPYYYIQSSNPATETKCRFSRTSRNDKHFGSVS